MNNTMFLLSRTVSVVILAHVCVCVTTAAISW